jgi:hypothetical protein
MLVLQIAAILLVMVSLKAGRASVAMAFHPDSCLLASRRLVMCNLPVHFRTRHQYPSQSGNLHRTSSSRILGILQPQKQYFRWSESFVNGVY